MIEELEKRLTSDGIHLNYLEARGLIDWLQKTMLDEVSELCQDEEKVWLKPGDAVDLPLDPLILRLVVQAFTNAGAVGGIDSVVPHDEVVCWDASDGEVYSYSKYFLETKGRIFRTLTPEQVINAENA